MTKNTLHSKIKIEQHKHHQEPGDAGALTIFGECNKLFGKNIMSAYISALQFWIRPISLSRGYNKRIFNDKIYVFYIILTMLFLHLAVMLNHCDNWEL